MGYLVLLNGAPGVGKSTAAEALAKALPTAHALDLDRIKHTLPTWDSDPHRAGLEARRLAVAEIERLLAGGSSVVLGQYLARPAFIEELETLAARLGAKFVQVVLDLGPVELAARLRERAESPTRIEHEINNELAGPEDAESLVASLERLRVSRPKAVWIHHDGLDSSLAKIRSLLD